MEKTCPRCGKIFECNTTDIFSCECADIFIPPKLSFRIDLMYSDCICAQCLRKMVADFQRLEGGERC